MDKKINLLDIYKTIRNIWEINPKTKVKNNKRKSRKKEKQDLINQIKKEEY